MPSHCHTLDIVLGFGEFLFLGSSQSSRQTDIHDLDECELQIPRVDTGARASRPGLKESENQDASWHWKGKLEFSGQTSSEGSQGRDASKGRQCGRRGPLWTLRWYRQWSSEQGFMFRWCWVWEHRLLKSQLSHYSLCELCALQFPYLKSGDDKRTSCVAEIDKNVCTAYVVGTEWKNYILGNGKDKREQCWTRCSMRKIHF